MPTRRRVLQGLAGAAAAMALPGHPLAAGWPERPVKLNVPFAPSGNTDGSARIIGNYLSEKLGETFVVDNRPGAGGIVAADALAKASPDGYTMLMVALPQVAIVPVLHKVQSRQQNKEQQAEQRKQKGTTKERTLCIRRYGQRQPSHDGSIFAARRT